MKENKPELMFTEREVEEMFHQPDLCSLVNLEGAFLEDRESFIKVIKSAIRLQAKVLIDERFAKNIPV